MSILQSAVTSFKIELLQAVHNFGPTSANTFKVALYTASADINQSTTIYTTSNEVSSSGTNYTAGGNTLVISTSPTAANNTANVPTAYISFQNSTWANATFTARAALIYNVTQGNKAVAVLDFGSDKTVSNDTFQIIFPTPDANSAIVRIS
jgi:hypothetical protein